MDTNNVTAGNGIISQASSYSVTETIDRIVAILQAKGITIFACIDQKAEQAGLSLLPTQLLLLGNPQAGTPLMVAEPTIALDLPLKVLAWEAADGEVWLSYNDPNYLKQRFSLQDNLIKDIAAIAPLIEQILKKLVAWRSPISSCWLKLSLPLMTHLISQP